MSKNERNFIPKDGKPFAIQYNGTQTSAAAPLKIWQAGAEGGKLYAAKAFINEPTFNGAFNVYYSSDGITFNLVYSFNTAAGNTYTKKLWTDWWDTSFLTDADGNKYINVPANGGFFVDVTQNTCTVDIEAYGEDY